MAGGRRLFRRTGRSQRRADGVGVGRQRRRRPAADRRLAGAGQVPVFAGADSPGRAPCWRSARSADIRRFGSPAPCRRAVASSPWRRRPSTPRRRARTFAAPASPTRSTCASVRRSTWLPRLAEEGAGPFDFVFIDADKPNNPHYLAWALRLARPGAAIVCDNVAREGAVIDPASRDPGVRGIRAMFDLIAAEPRLSATAIQTVGAKGWDGFALAIVEPRPPA